MALLLVRRFALLRLLLLHCGRGTTDPIVGQTDGLAATEESVPTGQYQSVGREGQYSSSSVVDAAAASAATATAATAVLSEQLRKLRPIKVVGWLDCVVATHVPNSAEW